MLYRQILRSMNPTTQSAAAVLAALDVARAHLKLAETDLANRRAAIRDMPPRVTRAHADLVQGHCKAAEARVSLLRRTVTDLESRVPNTPPGAGVVMRRSDGAVL